MAKNYGDVSYFRLVEKVLGEQYKDEIGFAVASPNGDAKITNVLLCALLLEIRGEAIPVARQERPLTNEELLEQLATTGLTEQHFIPEIKTVEDTVIDVPKVKPEILRQQQQEIAIIEEQGRAVRQAPLPTAGLAVAESADELNPDTTVFINEEVNTSTAENPDEPRPSVVERYAEELKKEVVPKASVAEVMPELIKTKRPVPAGFLKHARNHGEKGDQKVVSSL